MNILKRLTAKRWLKCTKTIDINRVLFVVLLIFIPLYQKFPLQGVAGTYVSVRLEDWLVLITISAWAISQSKKGFPILKEKITLFFLLYWAVGLVSLLAAIFITGLANGKLGFFHLARRVEYMSLFFIAYDATATMGWRRPIKVIILTSIAIFAYGMGQKYFGLPVVSTMNEEFSGGLILHLDKWTRISSTFAGHYDLAVWLSFLLSVFPALIFMTKKRWLKLLLIGCFLLNFHLLILTASRVSFVAYIIGISVTLVLLRKFLWIPLILIISLYWGMQSNELNTRLQSSLPSIALIQLLPVKNLTALFPQSPQKTSPLSVIEQKETSKKTVVDEKKAPASLPTKERAEKKITGKIVMREVRTWPTPEETQAAAARSSRIRFEVEWPRAVNAFFINPILGTGFSSLGLATDNDYLRVLGETGILGGLVFFLIIFHLALKNLEIIWQSKKSRRLLAAGLLGGLIAFLANAVFIDVFEASKTAFYFWMWMGIGYQVNLKFKSDRLKAAS